MHDPGAARREKQWFSVFCPRMLGEKRGPREERRAPCGNEARGMLQYDIHSKGTRARAALEQRERRRRRCLRRPDHGSVHRLGRSLEIPGGIRRSAAVEVLVRRLGFFRRSPGNGLPHSVGTWLAVLGGIRKAPGLPTLLGALELRLAVARGLLEAFGHFASPSLGPRTNV